MESRFLEYLERLATDPQEAANFQKNPVAAAQAAGLSQSEADTLKSRDPDAITATIAVAEQFPKPHLVIVRPLVVIRTGFHASYEDTHQKVETPDWGD